MRRTAIGLALGMAIGGLLALGVARWVQIQPVPAWQSNTSPHKNPPADWNPNAAMWSAQTSPVQALPSEPVNAAIRILREEGAQDPFLDLPIATADAAIPVVSASASDTSSTIQVLQAGRFSTASSAKRTISILLREGIDARLITIPGAFALRVGPFDSEQAMLQAQDTLQQQGLTAKLVSLP